MNKLLFILFSKSYNIKSWQQRNQYENHTMFFKEPKRDITAIIKPIDTKSWNNSQLEDYLLIGNY